MFEWLKRLFSKASIEWLNRNPQIILELRQRKAEEIGTTRKQTREAEGK